VTLTDPVTGQTLQALLNGDSVLANLKMVLYQTPAMPYVPRAIYDVYRGDYSLMVRLSNLLLAHFDVLTEGMEMSMLCAEDLIGRSVQEVLETRSAWPRQLVGSVDPTDIVDYGLFALCDGWAVPQADPTAKDPVYSDIPTLVLSGEFDPVTPPEFGKAVADRLTHAYFYELLGSGHVGESTSKCALQMTAAFLVDPLKEPDAACVDEMEELAFRLPGEVPVVVLKPYENEKLGIHALAPAGWDEPQPGLFTRGHPIVDMALLQLQVIERPAADIVSDLAAAPGLSQALQAVGVRTSGSLRWTLYTFATGDAPWDLALAESVDSTLLVAVRSAADERDALYEMLFLPVVDASRALE